MTAESLDNTVDIELLIDQVKSHKEIWNMADESYHDRTKKRNAWINICRVIYPSFDEKDEREKNELCDKLSKKWRNVKDNFYKSEKKKKTRENGNLFKRYVYTRHLSFLKPPENHTGEPTAEDPISKREPGTHEGELYSETKPSRQRKAVNLHGKNSFRETPTEPNSDMSFFESIMPFIVNFTEDQKLEFRSEVLDLIKRVKFGPNHGYLQYTNPLMYPKPELSTALHVNNSLANNLTVDEEST